MLAYSGSTCMELTRCTDEELTVLGHETDLILYHKLLVPGRCSPSSVIVLHGALEMHRAI